MKHLNGDCAQLLCTPQSGTMLICKDRDGSDDPLTNDVDASNLFRLNSIPTCYLLQLSSYASNESIRIRGRAKC